MITLVLQQHPNKQLRALVDNPPRSVKTDASNAMYFLLQALQSKQLVASINEDEDKFRVETQLAPNLGDNINNSENNTRVPFKKETSDSSENNEAEEDIDMDIDDEDNTDDGEEEQEE